MAKKATLGTIGKSLDCIAKNTCEKIDLSEITSGIEDVVSKLTENNTILTNIHSAVDGLENITEEIKNELKNQTTVITNKFNENIAKINEVKSINQQTYDKVAESINYIDNVETLLQAIKNSTEEEVDLTPVTNILTEIKDDVDDVESKLDEIVNKKEPSEIKGWIKSCIERVPLSGKYTVLGLLYGKAFYNIKNEYEVKLNDVLIKEAHENLEGIPLRTIKKRIVEGYKSLGFDIQEDKTFIKISKQPNGDAVNERIDLITNISNLGGIGTFWEGIAGSSNIGDLYECIYSPASLVKFFDKQNNEVKSKRIYYTQGRTKFDFSNLTDEFNLELKDNKPNDKQRILIQNEIKTFEDYKSLTHSWVQGTYTIKEGEQDPIEFPLGNLQGDTIEGNFTEPTTIDATNGKVYITIVY